MGFTAYQIANSHVNQSCDTAYRQKNDGVLTDWATADTQDYFRSGPMAYHVRSADAGWVDVQDLEKVEDPEKKSGGRVQVPCGHPIAWGLHHIIGQQAKTIQTTFQALLGDAFPSVEGKEYSMMKAMAEAGYFGQNHLKEESTFFMVDGWDQGTITRVLYNSHMKCYLVDRWSYAIEGSVIRYVRDDAFVMVDSDSPHKDTIKMFATPHPGGSLPVVLQSIQDTAGASVGQFFKAVDACAPSFLCDIPTVDRGFLYQDAYIKEAVPFVDDIMRKNGQTVKGLSACWNEKAGAPDVAFLQDAYTKGSALRCESLAFNDFWEAFTDASLEEAAFTTLTSNPYDLQTVLALVGSCDDDGKLMALFNHPQFLAHTPVGLQFDEWADMVNALRVHPVCSIAEGNLVAQLHPSMDVQSWAQDELLPAIRDKLRQPEPNYNQLAKWIHQCYLKQNKGVQYHVRHQWRFFEKHILPVFGENQDQAFALFLKAFDRKEVYTNGSAAWKVVSGQTVAHAKELVEKGDDEMDRAEAAKIWYRIWCRDQGKEIESAENVVAFIKKAHALSDDKTLWDHYLDLVTAYVPTNDLLRDLEHKRGVYDSLSQQERYAYNMAWTVVLAPIAAIWLLLLRFYQSPEYEEAKKFGDIEQQIHNYLERIGVGGGDHYCQYVMQLHHVYEQIPANLSEQQKWQMFLERSSETISTIQCLQVYHQLSKSTFGRAVQQKIHAGGLDIKDVLILDIGQVDGYDWSTVLNGISDQVERMDLAAKKKVRHFERQDAQLREDLEECKAQLRQLGRSIGVWKAKLEGAQQAGSREGRSVARLQLRALESKQNQWAERRDRLDSSIAQVNRDQSRYQKAQGDRYHRVLNALTHHQSIDVLDAVWLSGMDNAFCAKLIGSAKLNEIFTSAISKLEDLKASVDSIQIDGRGTVGAFKEILHQDSGLDGEIIEAWAATCPEGVRPHQHAKISFQTYVDGLLDQLRFSQGRLSARPALRNNGLFGQHGQPASKDENPVQRTAEQFLSMVLNGHSTDAGLLRTCAMVSLAVHQHAQPRLTPMRAEVTAM